MLDSEIHKNDMSNTKIIKSVGISWDLLGSFGIRCCASHVSGAVLAPSPKSQPPAGEHLSCGETSNLGDHPVIYTFSSVLHIVSWTGSFWYTQDLRSNQQWLDTSKCWKCWEAYALSVGFGWWLAESALKSTELSTLHACKRSSGRKPYELQSEMQGFWILGRLLNG